MGSPKPEQQVNAILDQVLGYLNFSSGNHDPKFLANINWLFEYFQTQQAVQQSDDSDEAPSPRKKRKSTLARSNDHVLAFQIGQHLSKRLDEAETTNPTFRDASQARLVLDLTFSKMLLAYRKHHRDLLFHQSDQMLFNSLMVGQVLETVLRQERPWDENQIVPQVLHRLNDYIGHRPIATLESRKIQPYDHEWIRPIPIYIREVGAAAGRYQAITEHAIQILRETDPHILRAAHFDASKLNELAIDPRAFDFDHPINQRPNHHFGQWDEHGIDGSGYFRRFIVHQVTIDALLDRAESCKNDPENPIDYEEAMIEASAVMAGTMLMASGISGSGPGTYDSNTTLSSLLPVIAGYRDQFYKDLMGRLSPQHRKRLEEEAKTKYQPFGGVRQNLNAQLAQRRASQLVNCRLASIFARMGYPDAAEEQSQIVPVAAARINCQIDCLLNVAAEETTKGNLDDAFATLPKIMSRVKRGIHCGAIVDPWNIIGFDANYSLFPAVENSVRDHRVFDLVDTMDRIFATCSRLWSEAAASDRESMCVAIRKEFVEIVNWWRKYAAHEVMSVEAVDADDIFAAAELVADALNLWHKGGAAAGDIEFWAQHAEMFDSPKAYTLVIDALMQRADYKTSTAIMVHWLSQADFIPLQQGDSSFHNLLYRWISEQKSLLRHADPEEAPPEEIWNRIRKFYDFIEANAEHYWEVPKFEVNRKIVPPESLADLFNDPENLDGDPFGDPDNPDESEEEERDLYKAAYDEVTYLDTTDDGFEGEVFDDSLSSDDALEAEVDRVFDRLEFHSAIAEYWTVAATIPLPIVRPEDLTESITKRMVKRREIILAWVKQATKNRERLFNLLRTINRYSLPKTGSDHDAMLLYDRYRLNKDALQDQAIKTCIETENAIRMLVAVVHAVDHLVDGKPLIFEAASSDKSEPDPAQSSQPDQGDPGAADSGTIAPDSGTSAPDTDDRDASNGGAPVVCVYAALLIQNPKLVVDNFEALTEYLNSQSILYVPLSKGGDPLEIVRTRGVQTAILDLLDRMPTLGLLVETHDLTRTALEMERNNPIGRGAVTEFDEVFEVAFSSMVDALVKSTAQLKSDRKAAGELSPPEISKESHTVLFDCIEMLTESMLILWLDHSKTLRLSVLEKVLDSSSWEKLVEFTKNYGGGLFTQQFLHLSNIRAILHQGVDHWLTQVQQSARDPDLRLFDELGHVLPRQKAVRYLTLVLESVIENYNEYRDYNTTTTQSDHGESLYMFLDFLRLRAKYDRVCWNLKPVVWAHRILVNEQENSVARMWRRSLTEKVGPEADKYLHSLATLRKKYSIQMASVARRLEGKFGHQMQIDRLKALVEPAMMEPATKESSRAFELLKNEARAFSRSTMGVGIDLPAWLATLENEVRQHILPKRLREILYQNPYLDSPPIPIAELREKLERLPRRET